MKCQFLKEGFGFPECYSIFKEPLYPVQFRYDEYCTKENHENCPFYQAVGARQSLAQFGVKRSEFGDLISDYKF